MGEGDGDHCHAALVTHGCEVPAHAELIGLKNCEEEEEREERAAS